MAEQGKVRTKAEEFAGLDAEALASGGLGLHVNRALWIDENRALVARALRRDEAIEEPSDVLIGVVGDAVTEAMTEGRLKGYSLARTALEAFREAVRE